MIVLPDALLLTLLSIASSGLYFTLVTKEYLVFAFKPLKTSLSCHFPGVPFSSIANSCPFTARSVMLFSVLPMHTGASGAAAAAFFVVTFRLSLTGPSICLSLSNLTRVTNSYSLPAVSPLNSPVLFQRMFPPSRYTPYSRSAVDVSSLMVVSVFSASFGAAFGFSAAAFNV